MAIGLIVEHIFPHQAQVATLGGSARVIVANDEEALDRSRSRDAETILRLTAAGRLDSRPAGVHARIFYVPN